MKKVELLAPAGSMEALQAAIQNGCDAVYLGGELFGARAYAHNFDKNMMCEAIRYAHGYGVKVYVTMNTLIFEEEMDDALAYAKFLYENQVDAIIVQDLGLFDLLHQSFPNLELHASTQMHIHNQQGISLLKEAGMKRVVVPRETSLETIRELSKLGVDLEVFVQGALCISYSGQCLMSSKKLQRSGNRGQCAQMCRMRYTLEEEKNGQYREIGKEAYLLSPKDLNVLYHVDSKIFKNSEIQHMIRMIDAHSDKQKKSQDPYIELLKDADVLAHYLYNPNVPIAEHEQVRLYYILEQIS